MATIYVARSAAFSKWASDVGLSKHVFKVGVTQDDPAALIAAGWAGETDWTLVKKQDAGDLTEEEALERLAKKEKIVDPTYYPRLKGATGVFKVVPDKVVSSMVLARALAGEPERVEIKLKVGDFGAYLIRNALG